jgi:hypothetical protein
MNDILKIIILFEVYTLMWVINVLKYEQMFHEEPSF